MMFFSMPPSTILTQAISRHPLEWGAPLLFNAGAAALVLLDHVQHASLRAALGCMRSTPIIILLSEAAEVPLSVRRSLLESRFILRNFSWNGNALVLRLPALSDRARNRGLRVNHDRFGHPTKLAYYMFGNDLLLRGVSIQSTLRRVQLPHVSDAIISSF